MGFQPPVPQQDTDWEIRAAVLASLAIQVFLIFVAPLRRRSASRFTRFVVWSCYLLADWVADLCLGLLLNSLGNIGAPAPATAPAPAPAPSALNSLGNIGAPAPSATVSVRSETRSPVIFAFWAPFLLLHLGGPDTITAFSVEDNELWLRHLIGLLFELSAAAVVFFCSLRGNPFVVASVFMFIVGIVKYAERTYCLYRGSADGLRSSMLGDPDPGPNYAKMMEEYDAKIRAGLPAEIYKQNTPDSTEPMIGQNLNKDDPVESNAFRLYRTFQYLFADLILSFNERKVSQKFFFELNDTTKAFELIEVELGFVYDIIFTKAAIAHWRVGYVLRLIGSACIPSAFLAFFFADKRRFSRLDVVITYTLLAGAAVLDIAAFVMLLCSDWARVSFADKPLFKDCSACIKNSLSGSRQRQQQKQQQQRQQQQQQRRQQQQQRRQWRRRRWSEKVSRMSLIGYCLDEPVGAWVPKWVGSRPVSLLADKVGAKEVLDETLYVRREEVTPQMKEFIFNNLQEAAKGADDHDKIKEVCERRGAGALKKLELSDDPEDKKYDQDLMKYVEVDFDHSLLLWHIATELCEHAPTQRNNTQTETQTETEKKQRSISMALSEYLVYLLVMQPAMLSTAAGIGLLRYRDTSAEARRFFAMVGRHLTPKQSRERLMGVNTDVSPSTVKGDRSKSVLFDACILAKKLNKLEKRKWEVVSEVWAEMLAYAACHCQPRAHARQLSRGGELATVVWLLMAHVGLGQLYQIQSGHARAKLIVHK